MRFSIALLAAALLVAVPSAAHAEPISGAIGLTTALTSIGLAAGTAASVGGTIVGLTISLGLSLLASAFTPKPKAGEAASGLETSLQMGGDVARQIPVGRCALKGQLAYVNSYGYENGLLHQVFILSDWPIEGLAELWLKGKKYTPTLKATGPGWKRYEVPGYLGLAVIKVYDGTQTAADPDLVSTANPAGRWTANARLTGLAYVVCGYIYDKASDLYEDGLPDWTFVVDGAKLYDRRKDSSVGGSGPQRWDDPATWAFSANPAVIRENYLRGFHVAGELILGMGVPGYDLVGDSFVAAANAGDETVTRADGSSEPRYRCGSVLSADEGVTHQAMLDAVGSTDAGYLYEAAGLYVCQAGVAQGVVRTVTDDDLVLGEAVSYAAKRSRAELVNRIHGQYLDPASGYQPQSYTARVSAVDAAIDGEELGRTLDLLSVASQSQAERIAEIRRREARAQATGSIPLGYQHRDLVPGDWIRWTSARFRFSKVFRIVDRKVAQATKICRFDLEETSTAVYAWSSGEEGAAAPVPVPGGRPLLPETVAAFSLAAFSVVSSDGATEMPGIQATWTPIADGSVDAVVIQLRAVGSTKVLPLIDPTPADGSFTIAGGLVPGTAYEGRATIQTTPIRPTAWTPWVPVSTGEARYDIRLADLDAEVTGRIDEAGRRVDALFRDIDAAFSPDPAVRTASTSAARFVQDTLGQLAEVLAGTMSDLSRFKGNVYEAGLRPLGQGGYGFAGFAEVDGKLNQVGVRIDNVAATVKLIASQISGLEDPEELIGSITSIQQTLDAVQAMLQQTASQQTVTELGTRLTAAQATLSALGTIVQETVAASQATDVAMLAEALAGHIDIASQRQGRLAQQLAYTSETASSRIDETGRAVAEVSRRVGALNGSVAAQFDELVRTIASGDEANATATQTLQAIVNHGTTGLAATRTLLGSFQTAQGTANASFGNRLSTIESLVNSGTDGNVALKARIGAEEATRADQYGALATRTNALEATVLTGGDSNAAIRASLTSFQQAQATLNGSLSSSVDSLTARMGSAEATISSVSQARIDGDNAVALIAQQAKATADGTTAGGRFAVSARAGANGTDVILAMQGSRENSTGKTDAGIFVVIPQTGLPRIVLDADQVVIGDLDTNDYPFEFVGGQLRLRNSLIAPGAIASADSKDLPANTVFALGAAGGGFLTWNGFSLPMRFNTDQVLDFEAQASIFGQGHGGNTAVRASVNFAIFKPDGSILKEVTLHTDVVGSGFVTPLVVARARVPVAKDVDYTGRFRFAYYSGNNNGGFYFKEANANYFSVIKRTT